MHFRVLLFLCASLACAEAETASGRWEGKLQIPGRQLPLIVDLEKSDGNPWTGSAIILGLEVKGAPLSEIKINGSAIAFVLETAAPPRGIQARITGELKPNGEFAGDFVQAGNRAPFRLTRTGPAQVEFPPRSTAVASAIEGEWKGSFELGGYPREVTLRLANESSKRASGEMVVVGKRTTRLPMDLITQEGDFLTLESHAMGAGYEGRFRSERAEIEGTFSLGSMEIPLVLRRGEGAKKTP